MDRTVEQGLDVPVGVRSEELAAVLERKEGLGDVQADHNLVVFDELSGKPA